MKQSSRNVVWLTAVAIMTLLMGTVYLLVQQTMRYAANEPQRSMAHDAAYVIQHNTRQPVDWTKSSVEMALSMAPFIIVYDKSGNVVSGNGYLDGDIPKVPFGVLEHAAKRGENTITWAPRKDVRIASVTVPAGDYYVLSGRSLASMEGQLAAFTQWLVTVWAVALITVAAAFLLGLARQKMN